MEDKKNYPSLPSNYVTIIQLQERWLKQKQMKENEKKQLQEQQQRRTLHPEQKGKDPNQKGHQLVVVSRNGTTSSRSAASGKYRCAKQYLPKIRDHSGTNHGAIEVNSEKRPKSDGKAGIGDDKANESKKKKKKKKKVKRKPKVDQKEKGTGGDKAEATKMEGNNEAENSKAKKRDDEKITIKTEVNGKSNDSIAMVEQKLGALSVNGRLRRVPNGFHHSQSQRNYGSGFRRRHQQKLHKLVWVKKEGNVDCVGN